MSNFWHNLWENVKDPQIYPDYTGTDLRDMANIAGRELLYQDKSINGNTPSIQNIMHRLGLSPSWTAVEFKKLPPGMGGKTNYYYSGRTESEIDPRGTPEHVRETIDHELGHAVEMQQGIDPQQTYNPDYINNPSNTGVHFATDEKGQMFNRAAKRGLGLAIERLKSNPWGNLPGE